MKNIIIILFAVLILSVGLLFYIKNKKDAAPNTGYNNNWQSIVANRDATTFPLQQGSRGKAVKLLQTSLGITADGIFGSQTKGALIEYTTAIDGSMPRKYFTQYWFTDTRMFEQASFFPLSLNKQSAFVLALNILLSDRNTDTFDEATQNAVQTAIGKAEVTARDFQNIGIKVLGLDEKEVFNLKI